MAKPDHAIDPRRGMNLTVRETPDRRRGTNLTTRAMTIRPNTLDQDARTVEAVIATERRATVFDYRSWRRVEEILLMRGVEIPEHIVMLDSHQRWSTDDIRGSIRSIRVEGEQLIGTLHFAEDEASNRAWDLVRGGHLTDISTGNQGLDRVEISPNTTQRVDGKTYTAGELPLIITRRWRPQEGSLVPIGADPDSKIREQAGPAPESDPFSQESSAMDETLREYLETLGLRAAATDEQAQQFFESLAGPDRVRAEGVRDGWFDPDAVTQRSATPPAGSTPASRAAAGGEPPAGSTTTSRSADTAAGGEPGPDEATIRAEATAAERQRQVDLRQMAADDVPEEILTRAINEGWTTERAAPEFLRAVRDRRGTGVPASGPAVHVRGATTLPMLQAAMITRAGLDPVQHFARFDAGGCYHPFLEGESREPLTRAAEQGWRYRDMSMVDICREACRLDGREIPVGRRETIRAAVSGGSLSAIFSTTVNARLMASYVEAGDSTERWVRVNANVPDFKTNERGMLGKMGALAKLPRGKAADHAEWSDQKEEYKVARYARQFACDEQDIIDDRFDALVTAPQELGAAARRLRPDLVYAILLSNAALGADSITLFHATSHGGNLITTPMGADGAGIKALILKMTKQTQDGVQLNLQPRFLLVPQDLRFTARQALGSSILIATDMASDASTQAGNANVLQYEDIDIISENRLGAAGVTDPATGTSYTGTATNFVLAASPSAAPTIEVGYLRDTGQAPSVRTYTFDKGQYGVGWDVKLDIGAKALDYRGLAKSTGAG